MINLDKLEPGQRAWEGDVGARRALDGRVTWYIRFRAKGRRIVETVKGARNKRQAASALDVRRAESFQGEWRPATKVTTVRQFSQTFLDAKASLATHAKYSQQLRDHLLPVFGAKALDDVSISDIEAYARKRAEDGAKNATVRNELRCLQSLFAEAHKARITTHTPMRGAKLPTPDEKKPIDLGGRVASAIDAVSERHDYVAMLFWIIYHTGMRLAHAHRLRWSEINFTAKVIESKPDKRGTDIVVPLHDDLARKLNEHRARHSKRTSDYVFESQGHKRGRVSLSRVIADWNLWVWTAGLELTRHDLRHAFVTRMDAVGASPKQIQRMTGQKTVSIVARYTHPELETLRKLIER